MKRIAVALMLACGAAHAQDYPSRPIRLVVPFSPGGITDSTARVIVERLAQRLGQSIVVENRAGASGNIGSAQVAQAAADGYTLLLGYDGTLVVNPHLYAKPPFDTLRDFAPVSKLGDGTLILVAHPSLPVAGLRELIALSKAKPGSLSYGSAGTGSTSHTVAELLKLNTGLDMTHVPYKGGGPALTDVVGGQIPLVHTAVAGAQGHVKQGRIRAICVSSAKRDPALPDAPTCAESGAPTHIAVSWTGVLAPAATPRPIIDRLNREINAVLAEGPIRERYAALGFVPEGTTPEGFGEILRNDLEKWRDVVRRANIRLE